MKTKLLLLTLCFSLFSFAQTPKLIALKTGENNLDIVQWSLGETEFESITENVSQFVQAGSAFFDSFNQNYFFKTSQPNSLMKYEIPINDVSEVDFFGISSIYETQIDMQNGNYYVLKIIDGELELNQTNSNLDSLSFLGSYDPITTQTPYLLRSSTFDSSNKNLYFIRLNNGEKVLYKTNLSDDNFEYSTLPLIGLSNSGSMSLGYSELTNELYCGFLTGNTLDQTTIFNTGKIDIETGEYEEIMTVDNLNVLISFNRSFDQNSNSFVILGADFNNNQKLYWVNMVDETSTLYDLPDANLFEIKCDNSEFVVQFFNPLSTEDFANKNTIIYPNPARDRITIESDQVFKYKIYNNLGQEVSNGNHHGKNQTLSIDHLSSGIYFLITDTKKTLKFIKK